jgi:two-component system chemotaxis response regulator CheB
MQQPYDRLPSTTTFFVAVGASGRDGLRDIEALINAFPPRLPAVVLIVLHRPSDMISHLCGVLSRGCSMPVYIAEEGEQYHAGACYIGEPAAHLALAARSRIQLVPGAHDKYRNRTIDLLFTSVAMHANEHAIGVVLSGDLDDGSRGLAAIHHEKGVTMVLDRKPSTARGMPENATSYDGPIDFVGSVNDIAMEIVGRVGSTRLAADSGM